MRYLIYIIDMINIDDKDLICYIYYLFDILFDKFWFCNYYIKYFYVLVYLYGKYESIKN